MTPAEQLTRALLDLAHQGRRPRCSDPETHSLWTSDDHEQRKVAARWCSACPILDECGSAGRDQTWGVWGGLDVSNLTSTKKKSTTTKGEIE